MESSRRIIQDLVENDKLSTGASERVLRNMESSKITFSTLAHVPEQLLVTWLSQSELYLSLEEKIHISAAIKSTSENSTHEIKSLLKDVLLSLNPKKSTTTSKSPRSSQKVEKRDGKKTPRPKDKGDGTSSTTTATTIITTPTLLSTNSTSSSVTNNSSSSMPSSTSPQSNKKIPLTSASSAIPTILDLAKPPTTPTHKKFEDVYDILNFDEPLGKGAFSVVWKGKNKITQQIVAVKMISKKNSSSSSTTTNQQQQQKEHKVDELDTVRREIDIMYKLCQSHPHPNIVQLYEVFDTPNNLYLILEFIDGGELYDQIVIRGSYTEADAAKVIGQVLKAVSFMHKKGVAHRDLKPENILVSKSGDVIKVSDFGLSKDFDEGGPMRTMCGTEDYVSPEVLKNSPYTNAVDIWSIGVITYVLLCGYLPFDAKTDAEIFRRISTAKYQFDSPHWDFISKQAKDFIREILVLDPNSRPTADDLLTRPWIVMNNKDDEIIHHHSNSGGTQHTTLSTVDGLPSTSNVELNVKPSLQKHVAKRKQQKKEK
eukprot:TRINITY_DN368_c0_g1_i1.p1 TRINITY_DN368_c0_g1~~TRINITY_DN368_c0_g1_i1.p1  ORF type:complete len:541 (-),score=168.36 TRINITY_DN368_c0_g1_i1:159-1781(-)